MLAMLTSTCHLPYSMATSITACMHSQALEKVSASSMRLWHGTMDLDLAWIPAQGGGFSPNSRAFAVDAQRVQRAPFKL